MNNGLPGPSTTDTITGGKTQQLSAYDRVRRPHRAVTDSATVINVGPRTLSAELTCPICLDLLTNTMTTKECLHRFCEECIKNALMRGNKECPTCRNKIVSKRSLRPDPNFDALISKLWPDRRVYERMQEASLRLFQSQSSIRALQQSIQAGMKAQATTRRMRVQGSYDYEKRKRRTAKNTDGGADLAQEMASAITIAPADYGAGTSSVALNGSAEDGVEMVGAMADGSVARSQANGTRSSASASGSDTSDTDSTMSSDDSESASNASDDRTVLSAISSASPIAAVSPPPPPSASSQRTKAMSKRATAASKIATKPPTTSATLDDKMNKWLDETQKCQSPIIDDGLEEQTSTSAMNAKNLEVRLGEMRRREEEIEVEFIPAKSLLKRKNAAEIPLPLLRSHFLKALPDITMEHFGEYLYQLCHEKNDINKASSSEARVTSSSSSKLDNEDDTGEKFNKLKVKNPARPAYFYILNHNNQVRKIFLHETLFSAFITSQLGDGHLRVFFDVSPPDVNSSSRLVTEIVSCEPQISSLNLEEKEPRK